MFNASGIVVLMNLTFSGVQNLSKRYHKVLLNATAGLRHGYAWRSSDLFFIGSFAQSQVKATKVSLLLLNS